MDYQKIINKSILELKPSGIRQFFDIVATVPDVISLGVGEPDFVTPYGIRDAAIRSIQKGYTQYTSNIGLPALREEIALFLKTLYGLEYDAQGEILVTVGGSEAIDLSLRTVVSSGCEVLIPDPSYVSYAPNVAICQGVPKAIKTSAKDGFRITPKALKSAITPKTKVIILSYPNNPTGAIMDKGDLEAISKIIIDSGAIVISDEIYAELTYGSRHISIATLPNMRERTVLVSGFSKAFAMTGWRVGYLAAPRALTEAMTKIHQYTIMCAPTASQYAAAAALREGRLSEYSDVAHMRAQYDMRRRFMVDAFNDMGLSCFEPRGAFYAFPSIASTGMNGAEFATKLLQSHKVAVVPGEAFGTSNSHIRCCYATGMKNIETAMQRIRSFLGCK